MILNKKFFLDKIEEKLLIYGVPVAGLFVLILSWPGSEIFLSSWYLIFLGLMVMSNILAVAFPIKGIYLSLNFPFVICVLIQYGPEVAMWICVPAALSYIKRMRIKAILFNMGQIALALYFAGLILPENTSRLDLAGYILWVIFAVLVSDLINFLLVVRIICLQQGLSFKQNFIDLWLYKMAPIRPLLYATGIVMNICFSYEGLPGILLATVPVLGIYYLLYTRTQLQEETLRAKTDELTRTGNKYALNIWWRRNYPYLKKRNKKLSLLMMDIDDYDGIKDLYGSDIAREVLKTITKIAENCIGKADNIFRYGRNELVIVLPNIGVETALALAEKITEEVKNSKIPPIEHRKVTIHTGISYLTDELKSDESAAGELLRRADRAVFMAKKTGSGVLVYSDN